MEVSTIKRVFKFNGATLPDPNPSMSLEKVRAMYANQYPELASANVGAEIIGNRQVVTFQTVITYKG